MSFIFHHGYLCRCDKDLCFDKINWSKMKIFLGCHMNRSVSIWQGRDIIGHCKKVTILACGGFY